MPATKRRQHLSVIERLLSEPYRFELIQALRMLDLWLRKNGVAQGDALPRYLRFQNSVAMNFPASQIEALSVDAEHMVDSDHALQAAFTANQLQRICITPAYMGFLGVGGVMPSRYTEGVAAQIQLKKYEGGRAFFDIFSNRIMSLHYQAWAKYRIRYRFDALGNDAFLPLQLALAGRLHLKRPAPAGDVNDANDANEDGICDEVAAYYAAMLRQRPVSAQVVAGVVAEYFGVPVTVKQFIGRWDVLGETELWKLGTQNTTLGRGTILGRRCWERDSRVQLRIGPLSRAQFDKFVPGASCNKALKALLSLFAAPTLEFELRLVLRAQDVQPVRLGDPRTAGLGMGAFLITHKATADRDDMVYELRLQD